MLFTCNDANMTRLLSGEFAYCNLWIVWSLSLRQTVASLSLIMKLQI